MSQRRLRCPNRRPGTDSRLRRPHLRTRSPVARRHRRSPTTSVTQQPRCLVLFNRRTRPGRHRCHRRAAPAWSFRRGQAQPSRPPRFPKRPLLLRPTLLFRPTPLFRPTLLFRPCRRHGSCRQRRLPLKHQHSLLRRCRPKLRYHRLGRRFNRRRLLRPFRLLRQTRSIRLRRRPRHRLRCPTRVGPPWEPPLRRRRSGPDPTPDRPGICRRSPRRIRYRRDHRRTGPPSKRSSRSQPVAAGVGGR